MSQALQLYLDFIAFLLGANIGSFLNVVIHRLPRNELIVHPPSHCPKCNAAIRWFDNIPLVSYVVLRGQCRRCGVRISPRYVLVELLTAVLFLAVWLTYGGSIRYFDWRVLIYWGFLAALIVATFVDLELYIIPDEITLGGAVLGFVVSCVYPHLHHETFVLLGGYRSVIGVLIGSGVVLWIAIFGEIIFKKEAMGFGDVKLLGLIGAVLGWQAAVFSIFTGAVLGSVVGVLWVVVSPERRALAKQRADAPTYHSLDAWNLRDEADTHAMWSSIPFGPFLAIGAGIWVFAGDHLLRLIAALYGAGSN